jgi:hypothetical protein
MDSPVVAPTTAHRDDRDENELVDRTGDEPDAAPPEPPDAGPAVTPWWHRSHPMLVAGGLALLVGLMALLMYASQRPGHWWGDDWALYVRQAKSLVDGDPGAITADNEFTVTRSLGAPFSPPLYPWGFPLILAPFVAVVGIDVDALAIVPVLSASAFACAWFALARRRLGTTVAFVSTPAITLTPLLFSWSELIQSEWPFLAVTFAMLVAIDRAVESRVLTDTAGRLWPLVLLGVGAAMAFSVRREGLAMTAAIAGAQLGLLTTGAPPVRDWFPSRQLVARLLIPHLAALATVYGLQWALPSTLVPKYDGTSIRNTYRFGDRLFRNLAEIVGLKRPWDHDIVVLGSSGLGTAAMWAMLVMMLVGVAVALTIHRRRDLHLVVYGLAAFAIGGSFRSAINRYMATVGPLVLLLALVGLTTLLGFRRRWIGSVAAVLVVAALLAGSLANVHLRVQGAERFVDAGAIEFGPTHPSAVEMFDAVKANSEPDDIVAGPKARALTLMTDRRSIQVDTWRPLPDDWSPELVVVELGSTVDDEMTTEHADRYEEIWSNSRFAIYQARRPDA